MECAYAACACGPAPAVTVRTVAMRAGEVSAVRRHSGEDMRDGGREHSGRSSLWHLAMKLRGSRAAGCFSEAAPGENTEGVRASDTPPR